MAAAAKTKATLYALAETAINLVVNGAAYELPALTTSAKVVVYYSPVTTTASVSGTIIRVQGSPNTAAEVAGDAGLNFWEDIAVFGTATAYTGLTDTINDADHLAAGDTAIVTDGSAVFGARTALLYIKDSTTVGEWVLAIKHVTTTLTLPAPGVTVAHLDGVSIFGLAEKFTADLDCTGVKRVRVVVDTNSQATGPTVAVYGEIVSYQPETA